MKMKEIEPKGGMYPLDLHVVNEAGSVQSVTFYWVMGLCVDITLTLDQSVVRQVLHRAVLMCRPTQTSYIILTDLNVDLKSTQSNSLTQRMPKAQKMK